MKARDVCSHHVACIDACISVYDAIRSLDRLNVETAVVYDGDEESYRIVGIIDRQRMADCLVSPFYSDDLLVDDLLFEVPVVVNGDVSLNDAIKKLGRTKQRQAVIVDGKGKLEGVLSVNRTAASTQI